MRLSPSHIQYSLHQSRNYLNKKITSLPSLSILNHSGRLFGFHWVIKSLRDQEIRELMSTAGYSQEDILRKNGIGSDLLCLRRRFFNYLERMQRQLRGLNESSFLRFM